MRGTQRCKIHLFGRDGIIPAYAGNTMDYINTTTINGDHPRVCGEHSRTCRGLLVCSGSSPRMRGTHTYRLERCRILGIIPAYAGNTRTVLSRFRRIWDHPRVCGEHTCCRAVNMLCEGSSPRMRGTHIVRIVGDANLGIIPAYAGNTSSAMR